MRITSILGAILVVKIATAEFFTGPRSPMIVPTPRKLSSNDIPRCSLEECSFDGSSFDHAARLRSPLGANDPEIIMYWTIDQSAGVATIAVEATNVNGWFGLGLSTTGGMMGADIWRLSGDSGSFRLDDMFVEDFVTPRMDEVQNLKLLSAKRTVQGKLAFSFQRLLQTCDGGATYVAETHGTSEDMDIIPGISQNLIFAWSNGPVFENHGRENRGYVVGMSWGQSSRSVGDALVDEEGRPEADDGSDSNDGYETWPDQVVMDFINEPYEIDHHRDTILVHTHFVPPEGGDWAIARIEQISDDALVMFHHHMLFYGCSEIPTVNNVSREERGEAFCNEILAVSPGFGLAVGGASSVQGFRVEVHYDGLTPLTSNLLDPGAGYRVTFVPNDGRIQEMGVLITGTFGLMIPSNLPRTDERNHFYGVCNIPDTIPDEGVTVLYNFWHMHLRGRGMYTRHIRNGVELEPLGRNNFYDWWYQGPGGEAPVGRKLLPGDQLIINCFYDTRTRTSSHERGSSSLAAGDITTFGEGTNDEMCFDFIAYYPRHPDLTNCFDGMGQGPAENTFDRRERNLKGSSTALMTFDSDAQEEAFLTAVRSDSPWVRMLLGEKLMSSIRSSFDEKDATGLVERRRTSGCTGWGCFDPEQPACFGGLRDACAPVINGQSAQSCFEATVLCHERTGKPMGLAHTYQGGACLVAFAYCGPCYPQSPCGGRFHFDLLDLDSFETYQVPERSCASEPFLAQGTLGGDSTSLSGTMIGAILAAVVVVGVVGAVIYVSVFKKAPRPRTPTKKHVVPSSGLKVVDTEIAESL